MKGMFRLGGDKAGVGASSGTGTLSPGDSMRVDDGCCTEGFRFNKERFLLITMQTGISQHH